MVECNISHQYQVVVMEDLIIDERAVEYISNSVVFADWAVFEWHVV